MSLPLDVVGNDALRRMKRSEYDRLVQLGVFEGERAELLWGVIVTMGPIGAEHNWTVQELQRLLTLALDEGWRVRGQSSFAASDDSEPEPDISVLRFDAKLRHEHPQTASLVVEVAWSSLRRDRAKAALYAAAGVPEYWIVDLDKRAVEVYTDPSGDRYRTMVTRGPGDSITAAALPNVKIAVDDVLP